MKKTIIASLALAGLLMSCPAVFAQKSKGDNTFGGIVRMDKTVHDFGDILLSDGPVTATFTATNIGDEPIVIYNVVSSCGCAEVTWTRQPIKPGESGTIQGTYKNNEGAYPFDKSLTVYFSGTKQPLVLRMRGESHAKKVGLGEMYPVRFGNLGFKAVDIKGGNLLQGQQKSGEIVVANLGNKPVKVSFKDVSDGLALRLSENPIPARSTSKLSYTVTADREHWGKNYYYATPLVNGRSFNAAVVRSREVPEKAAGAEALVADANPELGAGKKRIGIFTITKEDFSSWSKERRDAASQPMAGESTYSFGKVKAGTKVEGSFAITNQGKSAFKVYKVDPETSRLKVSAFPDLAAGATGSLEFKLDTAGLPAGEFLSILTLTTNSPLRPVMNLFVTGWIE